MALFLMIFTSLFHASVIELITSQLQNANNVVWVDMSKLYQQFVWCLNVDEATWRNVVLYTPYISRGFYFRKFRESGAICEFINTQKYLPPIPTHECDLCTQYIALLDREFNHLRKCLKFPIREKLDSQNIWRIQYILSLIIQYKILNNTNSNSKEKLAFCIFCEILTNRYPL